MGFYTDRKMTCALGHYRELETEGERRKFLDEFFGDEPDPRDGKRCIQCGDTGWVEIYHPKTVVAAAQGEEVKWWRTITVKCDCDAAEKQATHTTKRTGCQQIPIIGQRWHIRANDPDGKAKCMTFDLQSMRDDWQLPSGDRT